MLKVVSVKKVFALEFLSLGMLQPSDDELASLLNFVSSALESSKKYASSSISQVTMHNECITFSAHLYILSAAF